MLWLLYTLFDCQKENFMVLQVLTQFVLECNKKIPLE